ncbi:hypothetical protein F5I97DRAFT_1077491 [Phlebopus sp. FC_14]|nr:hypothetical protein F5I97DRAFT_1077491 [Phlebopus sp. FC_14]
MATTTLTSSSNSFFTITSTLDSSTSTTPTPGSSDGGDPNGNDAYIFTASGSPPLIVAFVAIGLFMIAMGVVFAWRRRQSRGLLVQPVTTIRSGKKHRFLGEKPILWDIWTHQGRENTRTIAGTRWKNLMPLSAVLSSPSAEEFAVPTPTASKPVIVPASQQPSGALRTLVATLGRFRLPVYPPPLLSSPPLPPPPASKEKEEVAAPKRPPDDITWREGSSLQISAIIAMPSRGRTLGADSRVDGGGSELGEFWIGTREVSWRDC